MPLNETEKLQALMLLNVPANIRVDFEGNDPKALLNGLSEVQVAEVQGILAKWNESKLDADKLAFEGLDSDPSRTESHLRRLLALAIGYRRQKAAYPVIKTRRS